MNLHSYTYTDPSSRAMKCHVCRKSYEAKMLPIANTKHLFACECKDNVCLPCLAISSIGGINVEGIGCGGTYGVDVMVAKVRTKCPFCAGEVPTASQNIIWDHALTEKLMLAKIYKKFNSSQMPAMREEFKREFGVDCPM